MKKKILNGMLIFPLLCLFLTGCGIRGFLNAKVGALEPVQEEWEKARPLYEISEIDSCVEYDAPVMLDLTDLPEEGDGYRYQENCLVIHKAGAYCLSGRLDGSMLIKVHEDEVVSLILADAVIESKGGPAVYVESGAKAVITLAQGSENSISDWDDKEDKPEAAVFSNCSLTINGPGKLYVNGYRRDGIRSKDELKLLGADVEVRAKNDGLRGNDGVLLKDSMVTIESEGTGIKAFSEQDYVVIQGGSCEIIAGEHAIDARRYVEVGSCATNFRTVLTQIKCEGNVVLEEDEQS